MASNAVKIGGKWYVNITAYFEDVHVPEGGEDC